VTVALKHVPHRLTDPLREARALAAVDHANLTRVRAIQRRRRSTVLVLDLAAGGTLADLLARRHSLPPGEVVAALTPIGAAIGAVHAAGLVHGDVSPANVLFGVDGLPLLSDLGSAYWLGDPAPDTIPAAGFADPMVEHGYVTGRPGDVYSLAATAFVALTGDPVPILADLSVRAAAARQDQCAAALADTPAALTELVLAGLALEPTTRPTAVELAIGFRFATPLTGVDLHAGRHTHLTPLPVITRGARLPTTAPAPRWWSRRRRLRHPATRDTPLRHPSR
jgi:serine/threonine protein kinase